MQSRPNNNRNAPSNTEEVMRLLSLESRSDEELNLFLTMINTRPLPKEQPSELQGLLSVVMQAVATMRHSNRFLVAACAVAATLIMVIVGSRMPHSTVVVNTTPRATQTPAIPAPPTEPQLDASSPPQPRVKEKGKSRGENAQAAQKAGKRVSPTTEPPELRVPNFIGKSMRQVLVEAAAHGLSVTSDGRGAVARAQRPEPGTVLPPGERKEVSVQFRE